METVGIKSCAFNSEPAGITILQVHVTIGGTAMYGECLLVHPHDSIHRRMVLSPLRLASVSLSGLNVTLMTPPVCSVIRATP